MKNNLPVRALLAALLGLTGFFWISYEPLENSGGVSGGPTLPGADEIYPTVMVNGSLYEWRRGRAILDEVPEGAAYYGPVDHIAGKTPEKDGEFASAFAVTGEIYYWPKKPSIPEASCVYLVLSSGDDWLEETVVAFDKVPEGSRDFGEMPSVPIE